MAAIDNPQDRYNYIRQGALARGIDPSLVDRLVRSEGGYKTFDRTGDSGRSFGPFQDYTGGGLGNQMRAQGLEPSNPALETQNIDWNLNYIAEHGASPDVWHGLRSSLPPEGEYGGATHVNVRPTEENGLSVGGALLLSSLLQKSQPPDEARGDTGNPLLNSIIAQAASGREPQAAAQHPPQEFIEPPVAQPPATVPELQPGPLPQALAPQPLPRGPGADTTQGFIEPPASAGPPDEVIPTHEEWVDQVRHQFGMAPLSRPYMGADVRGSHLIENQAGFVDKMPRVNKYPMGRAESPLQPAHGLPYLRASDVTLTPPTTGQSSTATRELPGPGFIPGQLHLNPAIAPTVPQGAARPFAPGEWIDNPNGSWSSEESMTVEGPGGRFINIPSLWLKGGHPYVAHDEDEALELAKASSLNFKSYATEKEANDAAQAREDAWQGIRPQDAGKIPPLWQTTPPVKADTGNRLLDTLIHGIIAGTRAGGPVLGPAIRALSPPATEEAPGQPQAQQTPPLERMLTGGGIVPPATTDIQQAQAEQRAQQAGPLSPVERLTQLGQATTPYIAGGAPGGAVSSGLRIGRGIPAAERIEPTFGATEEAAPAAEIGSAGKPPSTSLTPPPEGERGPPIEPPTMPDGKKLAATRQTVQDLLNWTVRDRAADSIEATQFVENLPVELRTKEFQEMLPDAIEQRLVDPKAHLEPEVERFLRLVKPLTDEENRLGEMLRRFNLTEEQMDALDLQPGLRTVEQGHIHRMPVGGYQPGEILPIAADPITGAVRGRSLSKTASGMQHRTRRYVSEDSDGKRIFSQRPLGAAKTPVPQGYTRFYSTDGTVWTKDRPEGVPSRFIDYPSSRLIVSKGGKYSFPHSDDLFRNGTPSPPEKYGDRIYQGGKVYTVREPTMKEIEANTNIRYNRNYLIGLINNVNRMRTVFRNLSAIEEMKTKLGREGLWVPRKDAYLHNPPEGMQRVELPQMDGWAVPRIANTLNDFTRNFREENAFEAINHYLIGSMFLLPVGHIRNVGMHYTIGRGLDWAYRNPRLAQSFNEVWHMGPIYQRWLRENGPAMYPGAADVHAKLVQKLLHDVANDPGWEITARGLRTTIPKLVKAMYDWSSRTLWFSNDHMFLARTMENMAKLGHPDPLKAPHEAWQRAINDAKRDIPAYEIPDRILGSRKLQRTLMSPVFAFGRYTHDKYDILAKNVIDMLGRGPHGKGFPQVEAAAKALLTLMLAFPVHSVLQSALQRISGNENAKLYGAGPTSIIRMAGGGIGKALGVDPQGAMGYVLGMNDGELDLSHALSGLLTFTPGLEGAIKLFGGGHDPYTGQPFIGKFASPAGAASGVTQLLMQSLFPTQLALEAIQQGPGALTSPLGFNLAGRPPPSSRSQTFQRRMQRAHEKRDPITQFYQGMFQ